MRKPLSRPPRVRASLAFLTALTSVGIQWRSGSRYIRYSLSYVYMPLHLSIYNTSPFDSITETSLDIVDPDSSYAVPRPCRPTKHYHNLEPRRIRESGLLYMLSIPIIRGRCCKRHRQTETASPSPRPTRGAARFSQLTRRHITASGKRHGWGLSTSSILNIEAFCWVYCHTVFASGSSVRSDREYLNLFPSLPLHGTRYCRVRYTVAGSTDL